MKVKSWQTTAVGFLGGLVLAATQLIALLDDDPETVFQMSLFLSALGMMGIGYLARDNNKSSEDVGTK